MWRVGELLLFMRPSTRLGYTLRARLDRSRVVRGLLALAASLVARRSVRERRRQAAHVRGRMEEEALLCHRFLPT